MSPKDAPHPHFGHTRHGLPVHLRTGDYNTAKHGEFNRKVALWLVNHVGTMRCFWLFCVIALLSLPATLHLAGFHLAFLYGAIPAVALTFGWIEVDAWVTQNFTQLVLLPAIMVGQSLQSAAADARAAKQFEDVEVVRANLTTALDRLDTTTAGGLAEVLAAQSALQTQINALSDLVRAKSTPAGGSG